jgi:hypothetical protein
MTESVNLDNLDNLDELKLNSGLGEEAINKLFNLICSFVSDIEQCFGNNQRSLQLYNRLLNKNVNTLNEKSKHVEIFLDFINDNRNAIVSKKYKDLKDDGIIFFSKKLQIKLGEIFRKAEKESTDSIWKHLLLISVTYNDKDEEAIKVLKEAISSSQAYEQDFLGNIMNKIKDGLGDSDSGNPMSVLSNLMQGGVLTDLMGSMSTGLSNGNLDIGKLLGLVQGMIGSMGNETTVSSTTTTTTISTSSAETENKVNVEEID